MWKQKQRSEVSPNAKECQGWTAANLWKRQERFYPRIFQNRERMVFCCFKPPSVGHLVTTDRGNSRPLSLVLFSFPWWRKNTALKTRISTNVLRSGPAAPWEVMKLNETGTDILTNGVLSPAPHSPPTKNVFLPPNQGSKRHEWAVSGWLRAWSLASLPVPRVWFLHFIIGHMALASLLTSLCLGYLSCKMGW